MAELLWGMCIGSGIVTIYVVANYYHIPTLNNPFMLVVAAIVVGLIGVTGE